MDRAHLCWGFLLPLSSRFSAKCSELCPAVSPGFRGSESLAHLLLFGSSSQQSAEINGLCVDQNIFFFLESLKSSYQRVTWLV
jgi:hypothetical protein